MFEIQGKASKAAADASPQQPEEDLHVEDEETEAEVTPTSLEVNLSTISETLDDELGCISTTEILYQAKDLTGGSKPVSSIELIVDGEKYTSWSGIPTTHYQDSTLIDSGCSNTYIIQLAATNSEGETITATKEAMLPPLKAYFSYARMFIPGGGEYPWRLTIKYYANDLVMLDNPLTSVVLKADGQVWDSSGNIITDYYKGSVEKLIDRDGDTFNIEVTATTGNGDTYIYRRTVVIPATPPEEPPEEPQYPPPPPPPPQTTLQASVASSAHCTAYGPECSCQLSMSFDGKDLTSGDYPVTHVVLKVNGEVWHDSGSISTTHYHQTVQKTVNCGETFNFELTVNNTIGQTLTSTDSITTPVP